MPTTILTLRAHFSTLGLYTYVDIGAAVGVRPTEIRRMCEGWKGTPEYRERIIARLGCSEAVLDAEIRAGGEET